MAKGAIPGQGQPIDSSTDLLWRDNEIFAEVLAKLFSMAYQLTLML